MKHLNLTILALLISLASFGQLPITGAATICVGNTAIMADATPGGTWSSSDVTVLSINPATGLATGIAAGVATVSYTVGTYVTYTVTVEPLPSPISCPSSICVGSSFMPSATPPGGTWSIGTVGVLAVGGTGVVIGVGAGVATITYTTTSGCAVFTTITVNPAPPAITGSLVVCEYSTTTLSDATPGGIWTSSAPGIAWIGTASGIANGVGGGTTNITYVLPTGYCFATAVLTVNPTSVIYTVTGGGSFCAGGAGIPVGLSNSDIGSSYTLYNGGTSVATISGTASAISFGAMTSSGTYTVIANAGTSCANTMTGSATITVNPTPAAITGSPSVCVGGTTALSDATPGGTWVSATPPVAIIGATTGIVTGIAIGTTTISYTIVGTGCSASITATVNSSPALHTVTGGGAYCAGGTGLYVGLAGSTSGVSYTLLNGGTVVTTMSGTGTSISYGTMTAAGTYTVVANYGTTCATTMTGSATIVINPLPTAYTIMGGGPYCSGGSGDDLTLSGSDAGINYQLYNGTTMVGAAITGTGTSIDFGYQTAAGTYTLVAFNPTTGCTNTMSGTAVVSITSLIVPSVTITGTPGTTVCAGTTVTFTPTPSGGGTLPTYFWSVNGIMVGPGSTYSHIPTTGDVVGVVMTSSALCASPTTASTTVIMTVIVPTITATATPASCGGTVTLTSGGGVSYSWSPTTGLPCPGCATNTFTPAATTTYTVIGTDGTGCTGTATATVDGNSISGYISYTGTPAAGDFTIWLVQFNPIDSSITATDSMLNCVSGGMPYYEFMDKPGGSYLVKAKLNSSVPGTSDYIPTYGLSSPTWDTASSLTHTTSADTMHINMIYGTVPPGPGFIAGYVYSGAGKNTSGTAPAANMTIYLKNAAGHIVTYTVTASDGSYSFHGIAEGSYTIYPESYKYYTTPSATIILAPGSDTATAINFKKHTTLGTITPFNFTKVPQLAVTTTGFTSYPNPTTGNLNIVWNNQTTGNATLIVTDMTGREILASDLMINNPTGQTSVDLSNVVDGVYVLTIRSDKVYYNSRLLKIAY